MVEIFFAVFGQILLDFERKKAFFLVDFDKNKKYRVGMNTVFYFSD